MKRKGLFCCILVICGVAALAGCRRKQEAGIQGDAAAEEMPETETEFVPERPIWQVMGADAQAWAQEFRAETVREMTYHLRGEEKEDYIITDTEEIRAFFEALDQITVTEQTEGYASNAGDVFRFSMDDGTEISVEFCLACFALDRSIYETQNADGLWELTSTLLENQQEDGV